MHAHIMYIKNSNGECAILKKYHLILYYSGIKNVLEHFILELEAIILTLNHRDMIVNFIFRNGSVGIKLDFAGIYLVILHFIC